MAGNIKARYAAFLVEFDIVQVSGLDAPLLRNTDGEEPSYYFEAPQVANAGTTETLVVEATGTDNINPPVTRQISVTVRGDDLPGLLLAHIEPDDRSLRFFEIAEE